MFPNWRSFRVGQTSFHSEPLEDESFSLTRSSAYNGSVRWWRWRLGIPSLSQTAGSTTVCAVLVTFFSLLPRIVRSPGTTAYSTCPSFFRDCLACRSWNGLSENCVKRPSSSRLRCSQRRLGCGCRVSEQTTFAAGGIFGYQVWGRTAVAVPRFLSLILFFVELVLRSFRPFNNFFRRKVYMLWVCSFRLPELRWQICRSQRWWRPRFEPWWYNQSYSFASLRVTSCSLLQYFIHIIHVPHFLLHYSLFPTHWLILGDKCFT